MAHACVFLHFWENISNDFPPSILSNIQQLRPRENMVKVIFHLVVFWKTWQIAILHLQKVIYSRSTDVDHLLPTDSLTSCYYLQNIQVFATCLGDPHTGEEAADRREPLDFLLGVKPPMASYSHRRRCFFPISEPRVLITQPLSFGAMRTKPSRLPNPLLLPVEVILCLRCIDSWSQLLWKSWLSLQHFLWHGRAMMLVYQDESPADD